MEEKKSVFRKKSLSKVSSPEELDRYLMVTGPGIWFTLIAIIILLIGVVTWGFMGRLDTTLNVAVIASDGNTTCLVPSDKLEDVLHSGKVSINGTEYTLKDVGRSQLVVAEDTDLSIRLAGQLDAGVLVNQINVEKAKLDDGIYQGSITVESVKPISFILN